MTGAEPPGLTVDGTGLRCVALLLQLRKAVAGLPPGTVVHVIATDPAAPLDLPAWCHLVGHTYLGPRPESGPLAYALRIGAETRPVDPARPWHLAP
ncbi:sulfurtransferase TusA family protein [Dactylosporangium sp. NPDC051485]|uniref:sulfurtransferase TusA family protein n=1 Tax=Dactylosporangium sp. NPDC051485 TaxID=3154846 RepID=UPI003439B5D1